MRILSEPEKNPDTGENEIMIKTNFKEIDYLREAVLLIIQQNLGDFDDSQHIELSNHLSDVLLQARNKLRPS